MNDTNPEKDADDINADGVAAPGADDVTVDVAIEVDDDGQAALVVPTLLPGDPALRCPIRCRPGASRKRRLRLCRTAY